MGKACQAFVFCWSLLSATIWGAALDSTRAVDTTAAVSDSSAVAAVAEAPALEPVRQPQDFRIFRDPPLLVREYGFGIAGSLVAGALSFYIGSGIESAIYGSAAHKGTLEFTGIRYDNHYGAFWGGATGLLLGSALTTYFVGETDEEEGGFWPTLLGTAVTTSGALALASWMGVNDEIGMAPFLPLLAVPSVGGVLAFNVSRMFHDKKRERTVGSQSSVHLLPPRFAWTTSSSGGDRLLLQAINLRF
jgi:hypothetical protein